MMMLTCLYNLVLNVALTMTPHERFSAMRQFDGGKAGVDFFSPQWLIPIGWLIIGILTIVLVIRVKRRIDEKRDFSNNIFNESSKRFHLTYDEQEIIAAIALLADLKHKETVFTNRTAFNMGLERLMRQVFSTEPDVIERINFHKIVASLRTKLGLGSYQAKNTVQSGDRNRRTTQQIPEGIEVALLFSNEHQTHEITAEVVENNDFELVLRPQLPLQCRPGEVRTIRYNAGAVIWEFETIIAAHSSDLISVSHSERIHYVNRRRFTRAITNKPAKIALFPVFDEIHDPRKMELSFVPATITEIAGPCLKVYTTLQASEQQRIILLFELEDNCMVQDVGEVRYIRNSPDGDAFIIELIGLNKKAVDRLVAATNQMSGESIEKSSKQLQEMEVVV